MYGIAFCKTTYQDELAALGFAGTFLRSSALFKHADCLRADSKTLTEPRRAELLQLMMQHDQDIHWSTTIMSPHDLSAGMLRKTPYNLCVLIPHCLANDSHSRPQERPITRCYNRARQVHPSKGLRHQRGSSFPTTFYSRELTLDEIGLR